MPASRSHDFAAVNGPTIYMTQARKDYKLSREQIMTLKPVTIETNKYRVEMRLYNKADVEDLKARVGGKASPEPHITHTDARHKYGLTHENMDTLVPAIIKENPHRRGTVRSHCPFHAHVGQNMRLYKAAEVQALAASLGKDSKDVPASPSTSRAQRPVQHAPRGDRYRRDLSPNPYDGLSRDDAAYQFYLDTGIVDSSAFDNDD